VSGGPSREELSADVVRYVLGEMDLDERVAFEVRLAEHDELAAEVMAAMVVDEHLHAAAANASAAPSRGRGARLVAAAALLAVAIGGALWAWFAWHGGGRSVAIAVLPTSPRYERLVAELGMAPGDAPAEAMRGGEQVTPDGAARVDELLRRTGEQLQRAVAAPASEVQGEAFVVPLTTDRQLWVAVVGVFDDGRATLYFPDDAGLPDDPRAGLLSPGSHVLPAPRAAASPAQRERGVVAFRPGFVVPLREQRVTVLVLTTPTAPGMDAWRQVRERVAQSGGDLRGDLARLLPTAALRSFVVRVP